MADTGQLQVQREVTEKAIGGEDARLVLTDPERGRGAQGGDAPLDLIDRSRLDLHANGKPLGPGPLHHRGYAEFIGFAAAVIGEGNRSEEHTSELQSLMRNSYAVFCLQKTINSNNTSP